MSLIAAIGCDNAKPLIDAADVKVEKLTQTGAFLRVDGANLSWFKSAKIEDSSGNKIDASISLKMDDYLMLDTTTGMASGGTSALTVGESYVIVLDAGLKEPFRSKPVMLLAGATPSVSLSSSQYYINRNGLLNLAGNCSINGLQIDIKLSQVGKTDQSYTAVCSTGTWSHTSSIFGFDDGTFAIDVTFSDGATPAVANASGLRDTVLPFLAAASGYMNGLSNVTSLPIQFTITEAVSVSYDVVAGSVCPATYAHSDGGTPGVYNVPGGFNISTVPDGQVTLCFALKDVAGNSIVEHYTWDKDTMAPGFSAGGLFTIDDGNPSSNPGYAWGFTGLMANGIINMSESYTTYQLFDGATCGAPAQLIGSASSGSSFSINNFDLVDQTTTGPRTVSVYLEDQAGNTSCSHAMINVDNQAPYLNSFLLNGGEMVSPKTNISYSVTATESGSGLDEFKIYTNPTCSGASLSTSPSPTGIFNHALSSGMSGTFYISASDKSGQKSSCLSSGTFTYAMPILRAYSAPASYFNDWITNDGSNICGTPTSAYIVDSCTWSGDKRKVLSDEPDCTALSVTDDFTVGGVFSWSCKQVDIGGGVYRAAFYATLKPGKGLKDLIESDGGTGFLWKKGIVSLTGGSQGATRTILSSGLLWGDTIAVLPDQDVTNTALSLTSPNTIYVINSVKRTSGYRIDASNISIVGIGMGKLMGPTSGGSSTPMIKLNGSRPWVEVDMDTQGAASNYAQQLVQENSPSCTFARIHNLSGIANQSGMTFTQCHGLQVTDVRLKGARVATYSGFGIISSLGGALITRTSVEKFGPGMSLVGASNATVSRVVTSDNDGAGFSTSSLNGSIKLSDVISSNNSSRGFDFTNGSNVKFIAQNLLAAGNGADGFYFYYGTNTNSTFVNLASFASSGSGFSLNNWSGSKFHYVMSGVSGSEGISISSDSVNNVFSQIYIGGTSGQPAIFDSTTTSQTTYLGTIAHEGHCSGTMMTSNCAEMGVTPVGNVNVDKSGEGAPLFVGSSSYLWDALNFNINLAGIQGNNGYRTFGQYASSVSTLTTGNCSSGSCGQWDWRLTSADVVLRFAADDGNGGTVPSYVHGSVCPSALNGNTASSVLSSGGINYLKNAVEISSPIFPGYDSNRGNHNGLCENGEVCLAAPNLGIYQGDVRAGIGLQPLDSCSFTPGTVSGVLMYMYPSNGAGL